MVTPRERLKTKRAQDFFADRLTCPTLAHFSIFFAFYFFSCFFLSYKFFFFFLFCFFFCLFFWPFCFAFVFLLSLFGIFKDVRLYTMLNFCHFWVLPRL